MRWWGFKHAHPHTPNRDRISMNEVWFLLPIISTPLVPPPPPPLVWCYSWPYAYLILSWWGLSVSMTILSSSEMSSLCASNITTIKSALQLCRQKHKQPHATRK